MNEDSDNFTHQDLIAKSEVLLRKIRSIEKKYETYFKNKDYDLISQLFIKYPSERNNYIGVFEVLPGSQLPKYIQDECYDAYNEIMKS